MKFYFIGRLFIMNKKTIYFLIPSLVLLIIFIIFPLFWSVIIGFTNQSLRGETARHFQFIGIGNYLRMFKDSGFINSVKVSLLFIFFAITGQLIIGLLFANLVRIKGIKGKKFISSIFLIPWITPGLAAAFMWKSVFIWQYGWLNTLLSIVGIGKVNWLFSYPLFSILLVNWSRGMALTFLLIGTGLEAIPFHIYEAAKLDGVSPFQMLTYIKLPLIKYSILVALLVNTFGTLSAFEMIFGLTNGGPLGKTEVFAIFIYNKAFRDLSTGYAGALSFVLLLISLCIGIFYIRSIKVEN